MKGPPPPYPIQEEMFLVTGLTWRLKMDAVDFTTYKPGQEYEGQPVALCLTCGKPGLKGMHRRRTTFIHRANIYRGALQIDHFCFAPEDYDRQRTAPRRPGQGQGGAES